MISNKGIPPLSLSFDEVSDLNKQLAIENFKLADRALSDKYFLEMVVAYMVIPDKASDFYKEIDKLIL